jgi:hypothetical protein
MAEEEPWGPADYAINGAKLLFAVSPLLALGYVLFSAFETPEAEALKRRKKGDFELDGHAE